MLLEQRLEAWIKAGLSLYRTTPLLTELVFFDVSHAGFPDSTGPGVLGDTTKLWIPGEFAPVNGYAGVLRYGGVTFPLLDNGEQELTVTGDPSMVEDSDGLGYQIIPPAVAQLTQLLTTVTFATQSSYGQAPAQLPAFTIRLERDTQGDTYIGESLESFVIHGVECDVNRATMTGSYLVSIWATNRLECLWLYAWLQNHALRSMQAFATWGLSDVAVSGSDLDPALQFLPERTYVRHLLLTATRDERALSTQDVEYITGLSVQVLADYARFNVTLPEPLP